jgi:hypothetical protein
VARHHRTVVFLMGVLLICASFSDIYHHLALLSVCNLRESHRFPTGLATAAQVLK